MNGRSKSADAGAIRGAVEVGTELTVVVSNDELEPKPKGAAREAGARTLDQRRGMAKLDPALPRGLKRLALVAALSGQRLGNVIGMKKADVNFEHANISLPKTKSGKRHHVPISPAPAAVLRDAFAANPDSPWAVVSRYRKLRRP